MDGTLTPRHVLIRGHGQGIVHGRDGARITIECCSRLLPGRPYVLQGLEGVDASCRMRVSASWVRAICGDAGVVYRVTFQPDSPLDAAVARVSPTPAARAHRG